MKKKASIASIKDPRANLSSYFKCGVPPKSSAVELVCEITSPGVNWAAPRPTESVMVKLNIIAIYKTLDREKNVQLTLMIEK